LLLVSCNYSIHLSDWTDSLTWLGEDGPQMWGRQDQKVMYPIFVEFASLQSGASGNKNIRIQE
jgi:hypothetical protein